MSINRQKAIRQEDGALLAAIDLRYNCLFHIAMSKKENKRLIVLFLQR